MLLYLVVLFVSEKCLQWLQDKSQEIIQETFAVRICSELKGPI